MVVETKISPCSKSLGCFASVRKVGKRGGILGSSDKRAQTNAGHIVSKITRNREERKTIHKYFSLSGREDNFQHTIF